MHSITMKVHARVSLDAMRQNQEKTQRTMEAVAEYGSLYSEARWNVWCVQHFGLLYDENMEKKV